MRRGHRWGSANTTCDTVASFGLTLALGSLVVARLAPPLAAEVLYFCNLVWHLGIAAMGFAMLVMGEREAGAS